MKVLSKWLRSYLPGLAVADRELAEALTLRGIAVEGVFELGPENGALFEMDITTNRVDAMNHYGIAREAAAIYSLALPPLEATLSAGHRNTSAVEVFIEAPELCGRFTARLLSGIRIAPSSGPVREYFQMLEQKLISNAVDATNFVTLGMGHPTHAFDRDRLEGGILLRRARKGEKLRTLDGVERVLDPEDLVVADEKKAISLAGVIGGWDTMITPETTNVLIEAAWFDPLSVRRTSKRHGLHTDASHRFERGADFNAPPLATALVAREILAFGGSIAGEIIDVVVPAAAERTALRPPIRLRQSEVRRILGSTASSVTAPSAAPSENGSRENSNANASAAQSGVDQHTTEHVLEALGCSLGKEREGEYRVHLPSWRLDLEREIDLIEEIARVYGYNRFANTLPGFSGGVVELPNQAKQDVVRRSLLAMGWNEALSSTFCPAHDADLFAPRPGRSVALGNPLNEEAGMLRPSLVPGMLAMLANNLNRNVNDVQLFEMGTVFSGDEHRVEERPALALGATGSAFRGPHLPADTIDFYVLKGAVEELLAKFTMGPGENAVHFDTFPPVDGITPAWLDPGRSACAVAGGEIVGWLGQLHREQAQERKLRQKIFAAEIYLDRLYRRPLRLAVAGELSRFQPVERDFSFLFPDRVRWRQIAEALERLRLAELVCYAPKEILRSEKRQGSSASLPQGQYSMLIGVTFQAVDRTLRDEELQSYSHAVVESLESLGGKQRA